MTKDQGTGRHPDGAGSSAIAALEGDVVGHGFCRLAPGDAPSARKRPGPATEGGARVPPSVLRYSDEQTVAGVSAVLSAIDCMGMTAEDFSSWGVVANSRFLGRATLAGALRSFAAEGVWGVSPHLIPHFALHSPSGTISLALGLHGPNIGVGGGQDGAAEGFLAALTWLTGGVVPGVWLVLSGWEPEFVPGRPAGECRALALALTPVHATAGRPKLRIVPGGGSRAAQETSDLIGLSDFLTRPTGESIRRVAADPSGSIHVELVRADPGVNHERT